MVQHKLLIPQINNKTRDWTTRVTVTEDIPIFNCAKNSKMKRYILTDEEGNEIPAVVFKDDIPHVVPKLQLFQVYDITNVAVSIVDERYMFMNTPYQWVLERRTSIEPATEAIPSLDNFFGSLVPFNMLAELANNNHKNVGIMVIIVGVEDPTTVVTVNGTKTIQRFTIVDMEKIPVYLTLWDDTVEIHGSFLTEAANTLSVVVAKRLSLSIFKGPAFSAKNSSSFAINPPYEAAAKLKEWIDTRTIDEMQELLIDQSVRISNELVNKGTLQIHTVGELANIQKPGEYWVKGLLQISYEDHQLFYIGCENCSTGTSIKQEGKSYQCYKCHKKVLSAPRPFILMNISDSTASMKVVAITHVAERILQTTAKHIFDLSKLGQPYDLDSLKSDFDGKVFLMMLRRSSGNQTDGQKKLTLEAFYIETDNPEDFQPTTQSYSSASENFTPGDTPEKGKMVESSTSSMSPLKRQMSQISLAQGTQAKKKLSMINADDVHESASSGT